MAQYFDLMFRRIETQALAGYYAHAYRGVLEGAIARTMLEALSSTDAIVKAGLAWIAFVPAGITEGVWYFARGPREGSLLDWEPTAVAPGPALTGAVLDCARKSGLARSHRFQADKLPAEVRHWEYLRDVQTLLAFETGDDVLPTIHQVLRGWIVLADSNATDQGRRWGPLKASVERVWRQIRDRLRLVFSAQPFTLRLLSGLDWRYQLSMLRAIEGVGLERVLAGQAPARAPDEIRDDPLRLVSASPSQVRRLQDSAWFLEHRQGWREFFAARATSVIGELRQCEISAEYGVRLKHEICDAYGYAQSRTGLAFFDITQSVVELHRLLVRLVEAGLHSKNTLLVCVAPYSAIREAERTITPWRRLFAIELLEA